MPKANETEQICKIFNLPVIKKTERNNIRRIRIFNIPVYKKYKRNGYNIRKYLFRLIKTKTNQNHKKIYLFGIQILCKKLLSDYEWLKNKMTAYQNMLYNFQKANIEAAAIHPKTFLEYRNKYENQSIVIIGCGPSAVYYSSYKINAVHIGVNRAFKLQNIDLDYLFVQDYMGEDDMRAADAYLPEKCKKFYGIIPDLQLEKTYPKLKRIPLYSVYSANASRYIIGLPSYLYPCYHLPFDIAYQPVFDCGGTVISALQFALYTNPKKIYLVGCDCSTGHFHEEIPNALETDLSYQIGWFKKFKDVMNDYCPNTEVISINPVGLKGMFKDIYTNDNGEYTDENGNIIDLNDNKTGREFSKEKYYTCY